MLLSAMRPFLLFICALLLLTACGTRGALIMPPKPTPDDHSSKPTEPNQ
jgi:predicted small lipoprotein YifL